MTGLRSWVRDPELPAVLGDGGNRPPATAEVRRRISTALLRQGSPPPLAIEPGYVRWKPGVSITSAYRLSFADGNQRTVVHKRYAGDKARSLSADRWARPISDGEPGRLRPVAVAAEEGWVLWAFPAERVLKGLRILLDRRKMARFLERSGIAPPRAISRRRMEYALLRYKPERRALFRLRLVLRGSPPRRVDLAVRVLPRAAAARLAAVRRALPPAVPVPRLAAVHLPAGILVEPWLRLETFAPDSFAHAEAAGRALATLHLRPAAAAAAAPGGSLRDLLPLLRRSAELGRLARGLSDPDEPPPRTWIHGDLHPDQVALSSEGWRLLDLDLCGVGTPARDLASWIADHLVADPDVGLRAAAAPLVAGYRGGGPVDDRQLAATVAAELVRRAAGALRRLERGAIAKAARALTLARDVAPRGAVLR